MDLAVVRALLRSDPGWAAFALADLAPPYSEHSEWRVNGGAVLLVYRAFQPPVLFALGNAEPLLAEIADPELYLSVRCEVPDRLRARGYEIREEKRMLRMVLDRRRFAPPRNGGPVRLGPGDERRIRALFRPAFFDGSMLRHGVYFGVREGGKLVALAGTHVLAVEEGVAAVGNVYTHPDRRGRGLGRQTTAAVVAELLRLGVGTIALNVEAGNAAAIRVYERLGFFTYCEYREAVACRMLKS